MEVLPATRFEGRESPGTVVAKIDVEGFEYAVIRGLRETPADPSCLLGCCGFIPPCCRRVSRPAMSRTGQVPRLCQDRGSPSGGVETQCVGRRGLSFGQGAEN